MPKQLRFFEQANAAHHPTPGQQDYYQLQVPSLAHDL
jgi:hypothetical protein